MEIKCHLQNQVKIKHLVFLLSFLIYLTSCQKDEKKPKAIETVDYRDKIVGDYEGIYVYSSYDDNNDTLSHDTNDVVVTLKKEEHDSLVVAKFDPTLTGSKKSFELTYRNGKLISDIEYHPPSFRFSGDSLYFYYHPVSGPIFHRCYTIK
ncbi:hypothetical protein [Salibacter halophilus]|uniref:Uncharacterized protein n=1 Tax=Salibacter halophilus TaxID=1803916 RepID=A0A6N6M8E8_9FLAO|nr:hypothetical protein [Salibacter halophilus]KAB1064374.1 hypothetical protein F3059_06635 [Salibacter halophilus]